MAKAAGMILGVLTLVTFSGCASMLSRSPAIEESPAYPPSQMVTIEFHPAGGKVKSEEIPLEPGMTVGDALEKANATRRYRRTFVDVQRVAPGGLTHKMPVEFNNGEHRVGHSTNYALYPNDRVLVSEDPSNIFDDLMTKYLGAPKRKRG